MRERQAHSSVTSLLMLGVMSATLLYGLVFSYFASTQFHATAERLRSRLLVDQAALVAAIMEDKKGEGDLDHDNFYQYVMRDAKTGHVVRRSAHADLAAFPPTRQGAGSFTFDGSDGKHYRGVSVLIGDRIVQIAQNESSLGDFSDMLGQSTLTRLSLYGIPFLALLMLVVAMSVKLIMSPISKSLKQLGKVSFDRPDLRLDVTRFPSELQPLADAINGALGRIGGGIEAQKEFVANAAHELRTPLAVLRAHLDNMGDTPAARQMRQDVDGMARLVGQLLDTARLAAPEPLPMRDLDVNEVARDAAKAIWPLVVARGRTLDVAGLDRPFMVKGNADMIGRAVRNLLENALHHTPAGSSVELSAEPGALVVRDHGAGIAADRREAIFERFSRGDSQGIGGGGGGAGLGLFIVRRVMALHGGTATVENAPGGGARFVLKFDEKLDKKT